MSYDNLQSVGALPAGTALIVIDVQKGLDEPYWACGTTRMPNRTSPAC